MEGHGRTGYCQSIGEFSRSTCSSRSIRTLYGSTITHKQSVYGRLCSSVRSYCVRVGRGLPVCPVSSKYTRITTTGVACASTSLLSRKILFIYTRVCWWWWWWWRLSSG
ncbi:unnamed protein product [Echinostoma caproni]|uniref:Uncharacterized protein n=1 Tax=Echinostoma caproni TaxID=27848 RepID=A0A3P8H2V6_9TREM|nr:unnamed protein product [Echinostoma caproni]